MSGNQTMTTQAVLANIQEVAVRAIAEAAGDDFEALSSPELHNVVSVEINKQVRDLAGV